MKACGVHGPCLETLRFEHGLQGVGDILIVVHDQCADGRGDRRESSLGLERWWGQRSGGLLNGASCPAPYNVVSLSFVTALGFRR